MLEGPPVRPNISLGDSVAGLHAAFGTVLALLSRNKRKAVGLPGGQSVDISILESMLNLMEGIIPEYDRKGVIRGPSGSSVTGIVPTNAYPTSEPESFIVIGANGDSIYNRLMTAIGRTDLVGPDYANNHHRVVHQKEIEKAISEWTGRHTTEEVCEAMETAKVPHGKIMNVKDLVECEHLIERGMVEEVYVTPSDVGEGGELEGEQPGGWTVKVPGVAPKLEGDWSRPTTAGPNLGAHNAEVLGSQLGLGEEQIHQLRMEGVVA